MMWNPFRRRRRVHNERKSGRREVQSVIDLLEQLLSVQLILEHKHPREAFSTLMTNKVAAGYVFGFHDACFHIYGLIDPNNRAAGAEVLRTSYKRIFGDQTGFRTPPILA